MRLNIISALYRCLCEFQETWQSIACAEFSDPGHREYMFLGDCPDFCSFCTQGNPCLVLLRPLGSLYRLIDKYERLDRVDRALAKRALGNRRQAVPPDSDQCRLRFLDFFKVLSDALILQVMPSTIGLSAHDR
jgi:hypothetical protein